MSNTIREDAALGSFILALIAGAIAAWTGVSGGIQIFLSFAITLTLGAVLGSLQDHDDESIPKPAIPFVAVGMSLSVVSTVVLVAAPLVSLPILSVKLLGPGGLAIALLFMIAAGAIDEQYGSSEGSVPDDPEAILDDGGDE